MEKTERNPPPPRDHPHSAAAVDASGRVATVRVLGCPLPRWARWPAALAFTFFLVKGLIWIAVLMLGWKSFAGT